MYPSARSGMQIAPCTTSPCAALALKEHCLIAGRSGSGKTNLTFMLMQGIMQRGIKVLALDWKRGYRDLLQKHPDLRVYTIGRDVAPVSIQSLHSASRL